MPTLKPNTRFKYSNHGYGLLGLVVEAVTGEPYRAWMKREIIEAAGLAETLADGPPSGARRSPSAIAAGGLQDGASDPGRLLTTRSCPRPGW